MTSTRGIRVKKVRVLLNVGVSLEVTHEEEEDLLGDLEDYIASQIGLDFQPLDVWCEIHDVEVIDEGVHYWGYPE